MAAWSCRLKSACGSRPVCLRNRQTWRPVSYTHLDVYKRQGQSFGSLLTGTIVTETLFNIPGLGMLTMTSITRRDVFVIQGVVLFVTFIYVLVNLAVDILYGFVDPRIQLGNK